MSENKITPTPWKIDFARWVPEEPIQGFVITSGNFTVCALGVNHSQPVVHQSDIFFNADHCLTPDQVEATGNLLSAAPDLYEALKFVRESPQFKRMDWKLKVTIDAAIAKAKLI